MKKILLSVLFVALFSVVVYAGTKTLNFAWNQTMSAGFAGWKLYQGDVSGATNTLSMTIPYGGTAQTEYTGTKNIVSPDGQTKTYYFTMTAFDTSGNESAKSNEVSATIDFEAPGVPTQLKVTVTTP
jgi:hypothetical protein